MLTFTKEKISALSGLTEVRFTETSSVEERPHDHFMVIADRRGVRMQGRSPILDDEAKLQSYAKAIADAWSEHGKLKPKLESV